MTFGTATATLALLLGIAPLFAAEITVDLRETSGTIRPLHGINKGPLAFGGLIDLTEAQRTLGIPWIRLHDCQWPYPDVIDMHAVVPNADADPSLPASYEFRLTDEYLSAAAKTGARFIYRLGESIEHGAVKRYVHPPRDPERWAAACVGIVGHYNEGWANGFRHNVQYWEIWNEPENRPAMWTGTEEEYFTLYRITAKALRHAVPDLKIGGPSVGYSGKFDASRQFIPGEFVTRFLERCKNESLPLDFFSWHCYTADVSELTARARAIRALLDRHGFTKTESHLNEWNYLPGNSWSPISKTSTPEARDRYYKEMAGATGAAFIAAALIEMQDAPVDMANLFHGELGGFGLFNENGVPNQNYFAISAFNTVCQLTNRVRIAGTKPNDLSLLAATDNKTAAVLVANVKAITAPQSLNITIPRAARYQIKQLSFDQSWKLLEFSETKTNLNLAIKTDGPTVTLIQFSF